MSKSTPTKASKNVESKKQSAAIFTVANGHASKKEVVNGEGPLHDAKSSSTWICRNLACKAVVASEESFCKRCSCCICHQFDDNKDPSLWLVCASENDDKQCCGSSCHIECAFQYKRVGCFDIGKIIHLDGSYSCASCGKVSGILSYWRRQLVVAKEARRVDILCHRIYVSYRLLEGTSCHKELHDIIEDAKAKLEREVGPLDGMSAKMARGIVSRLSGGNDILKLCSQGIQRADELLSSPDLLLRDSLPAACRFRFEDITSSSLVIILKETRVASSDSIKGYKLWHWKSREQPSMDEPVILSRDQRKILVFNLATCTEYSFRIISFTDDGILGHSESKCYTGSNELITSRAAAQNAMAKSLQTQRRDGNQAFKSSGFRIRDVGKFLRRAWAEEGLFQDIYEGSCDRSATESEQQEDSEEGQMLSGACRRLQFNAFSVPDLNVEAPMPMDTDSSPEKCCDLNNGHLKSNDSGGSEACAAVRSGEPAAVESRPGAKAKQLSDAHNESCGQDEVLAMCRKKLLKRPRELDEDYEHCVKTIRSLECKGHIDTDFRMKFLTWLSLRSTENEHKVVSTFIKTLSKEPSSLAEQLVDSFGDIVNCKRPKTGLCSELFHLDKR